MTDVATYATDWRAAGACASADPELFYPIATGVIGASQAAKAQRICAGCGVRQQCLDFAVQTGEMNGIWGGTTPEERIRARRAQLRRRRAHRAWEREAPAVRAS
jgi:WhiB family transcriptional regulator, redox-sensing transcriptional regulator